MNATEYFLGQILSCSAPSDPDKWRKPPMNLTEREERILTLICQGKTQKEIAAEVYLSHDTIDYILDNLRKKHNCFNTTQLAVMWVAEKVA